MNFDDEAKEIILTLQKAEVHRRNKEKLHVGDIVRWTYEWIGDPDHGQLYAILGFNSENIDIAVTCLLGNYSQIREFHVSQLTKV